MDMDRKLYKETFDEITIPQNIRKSLLDMAEGRENHMRYLPGKKTIFIAAIVLVLCLGGTCTAALYAVRTNSDVEPATLTHNYNAVKEAQKETGLEFDCPETLGNGFLFGALNINEDVDYDENGNVTGNYRSIYISYLKDTEAIIYQVSPIQEAASQTALNEAASNDGAEIKDFIDSSGKVITYYYQIISQNIQAEQNMEEESVVWSDGNNFYKISGYNMSMGSKEWFNLAQNF